MHFDTEQEVGHFSFQYAATFLLNGLNNYLLQSFLLLPLKASSISVSLAQSIEQHLESIVVKYIL